MEIKEQKYGDVAVLTITGPLTNVPEVTPIYEQIRRLIEDGITKVVLDLSKVNWVESSMLNVMTKSLRALWDAGGNMILVGTSRKIQEVLRVTHLTTIFDTLHTVDQDLAGFKTQPLVPALN